MLKATAADSRRLDCYRHFEAAAIYIPEARDDDYGKRRPMLLLMILFIEASSSTLSLSMLVPFSIFRAECFSAHIRLYAIFDLLSATFGAMPYYRQSSPPARDATRQILGITF